MLSKQRFLSKRCFKARTPSHSTRQQESIMATRADPFLLRVSSFQSTSVFTLTATFLHIHACLLLHRLCTNTFFLFATSFSFSIASYFVSLRRSSSPFVPPGSSGATSTVSNSTVSINLTITPRWIRGNGHIPRAGSQSILVSCFRE